MLLGERQQSILEAIVHEYIRTAKPVASTDLSRKQKFSFSPATVRNEMLLLDEMGFLEQPHTSAGRIPTDKGYRFFVDHDEGELHLHQRDCRALEGVLDIEDDDAFAKELSRATSRIAGLFTAVGISGEPAMFDAGLSEIFQEPEFRDMTMLCAFGALVDELDEEMRALIGGYEKLRERVFIGHENPVAGAQEYAMVISEWHHPRGFKGYIALVGPKRMDYRKNIALIRYINNRLLSYE